MDKRIILSLVAICLSCETVVLFRLEEPLSSNAMTVAEPSPAAYFDYLPFIRYDPSPTATTTPSPTPTGVPQLQVVGTIPFSGYIYSMALDTASNHLYVGTDSDTIIAFDATTFAKLATIPAVHPFYITVDSSTHRLYATTHSGSTDFVTIVDDTSNTVINNMPLGIPGGLTVNPVTHTVYQASVGFGPPSDTKLFALGGLSYAYMATIPLGGGNDSSFLLNDSARNMIYDLNEVPYPTDLSALNTTLTVINGQSNAVVANILMNRVNDVAVSSTTHQVYVAGRQTSASTEGLVVINGLTNTITADIPLSIGAMSVAVNESTNKIYSCGQVNLLETYLTRVDGATYAVDQTLDVGPSSASICSIAANSLTKRVFLWDGNGITVIQDNGSP